MRKSVKIRSIALFMTFILALTAGMPIAVSTVSATEADHITKTDDCDEAMVSADDISEEATEDFEEELFGGGLMQVEMIDLGEVDADMVYVPNAGSNLYGFREDEDLYGSAQYKSAWDIYSTNYYYNQLDDGHRAIWDELDVLCLGYLTNSGLNAAQHGTSYGTELIYYECPALWGMSNEEVVADMKNFVRIFRVSNPQYYFLKASFLYGLSPSFGGDYNWVFAIGIYPEFQNGAKRAGYTAKVKNQADAWISQAKLCDTDSEKLRLLHDTIAKKVQYNHAIIGAGGEVLSSEEDYSYSQSAYSVFCTNTTVCAGYSQALAMELNGLGIDCIAVTSSNHEWNKVRINNSWYNVDCTWDDLDNSQGIFYKYYGRSDSVYADRSDANYKSHITETFWRNYLPVCDKDTNPSSDNNYAKPGSFPAAASVKAGTPTVMTEKLSVNEEEYRVTLSNTEAGAKIYYTLRDTETPSEAFYISNLYKGSFVIGGGNTITAVAVKGGKEDSLPVVCEWHTIEFAGNGSDYGTTATTGYYNGGSTFLSVNGCRKKDHLLKEWNTRADGTGIAYPDEGWIDTAAEGWSSDMTLYAQWVEDNSSYSISYVLNGGIQNASNRTNYKMSTDTFSLYAPTKANYVFAGWYLDAAMTKRITQIPYRSEGNIILYAKWTPQQYKIAYYLNGGVNNRANPSAYDVTRNVTFQNPERTGYAFAGWYSDAGYKNRITGLATGSSGVRNIYAKWKANKYTIVFKANGGKGKMSKMTCTYDKKYKLKANKFTREGYKFVGWTTKKNGKGKLYKNKKQIKNLTAKSNGKVTLYAKWKKLPE